jgi:hypothetical protein
MTEASLLHRGCYGLHATTGGCKSGALPVAVGWRWKRSAPLITGQLVPLTAASQNSWMGG